MVHPINLTSAEIAAAPPRPVLAAAMALLSRPSAYTPPGGNPALREVVARHLSERSLRPTEADETVLTTGASGAIAALVLARVPEGGAVLVPDPGLPLYERTLRRLGRRPVRYPSPLGPDDGRWADIVAQHGGSAHALLWNSPHNPTGVVHTAEQLRSAARLAAEHGLFLISDEVFHDLVWHGTHHSPLRWADPEASAGVWSASKSLRLCGLRVGWLAASRANAGEAARAAWELHMSSPVPGQVAMGAALRVYGDVCAESRAQVAANLPVLAAAFPPGWATPTRAGTCLWVDTRSSGMYDTEFAAHLHAECGVAVWPGSRFGPGGRGHIRVNAGAEPAAVREAARRIRAAVGTTAEAG
ncbi:aspartate/methionine/tyrosine aminotransferase [Streptomyces sp. V4I23]|uniref:pyridoxal phosphate-dependent aminotransferase n=1 Tax=Streptomyces sp. V4I23 TaxID=3042282 RepID=UPI0027890185|nr:pyridoxal phosphate-dependent aminotransferase [Streptomyces sp. V4I23]MDQ1007697.1 aspartate/methionine/tyrosine aminotransferase [Streptomyces sp. V4I23]